MNKFYLNNVIGIIIILFTLIVSYFLLSKLFIEISKLNPNVIASIIAALTAIFGYYITQRSAKLRDINESHRLKKIEMYKEFMKLQGDVLLSTKDRPSSSNKTKLPKDAEQRMLNFTSDLITWGSVDSIKAFKRFREGASTDSHILLLLDKMFLAFRKDLGHSSKGLKDGDLIKLYLTDPAEFDKTVKL